MRLIDADALIAEMHNVILEDGEDRRTFYAVIERQPTIDAVPVFHGHWENVEPAIWADVYATCSVCKKRQTLEKVRNFCPNCGAFMEDPTQTQHVESVGQHTQDVECVKVKPRRVR